MNRWLFVLVLLFFSQTLLAQEQKTIKWQADRLEYDQIKLPDARKLMGNVIFSQDNTIGYCDSAYLYQSENYIVAFGDKVRIVVNDSVTLYGKHLIYNGNTRIVSMSVAVELHHNQSVLYTDSLIYNLNDEVGYYITGGKMVNKDNTLTSLIGHYYTKQNKAYLNENVHLVNNTYTMNCQSLVYNTNMEIVYFTSRTHLLSSDNEIYTTSGWYDTRKDLALLVNDVEMYHHSQTLFGDSVYYDKKRGYGTGWNNIAVIDTAKGYLIKGNYVEYHEFGGISTVTDSSLLVLIDRGDSLFLHADTINIQLDSMQEPERMMAYYHTKFFRDDLQGACDSLTYITADSTIIMYYNPVVWSGENQLTGDTIRFCILPNEHILVELCKGGFIASSLFEETEFNQIKGSNIIGFIYKKELIKVDVINNAECLYYIQDQDSSLIGINSSATSEMQIRFKNNEVEEITFYNNPDGFIYPDKEITEKDRQLKDFRWLKFYRPQKVQEIFIHPITRKETE